MSRQWERSKAPIPQNYRLIGQILIGLLGLVCTAAAVILFFTAVMLMQDSEEYTGWIAIALMAAVIFIVWIWMLLSIGVGRLMYRIHFWVEKLDS